MSSKSLPIYDLISEAVDQEACDDSNFFRRVGYRFGSIVRNSRLSGLPLSIFYGCFIYHYATRFILNDLVRVPENFTTFTGQDLIGKAES